MNRDGTLFVTRGGCASCLRAFLGARLLPQSYQYPNLSEGADRVDGQLRGDKECPLSGVTKSGRVWRTVPESGVRSVQSRRTFCVHLCTSLQCHFMQSHVRKMHACSAVTCGAFILWGVTTLRASLSGTFLQTLPDLVTPLKGHSLSPRSCPSTRSAPSERFGY